MDIRKGDTVFVLTGKDKGKQGKIARVLTDVERVAVTGVNMVKRHTKARPGTAQAGIVQRESPIHVSNVVLICSKCGKTTRVSHKVLDDGKKVRICLKCKEAVE
ncbi:MAG: 50S ribosomal protein L24 [Chloroflexota bacterium]|nr:50S ribosomal protein L24 [Chloroflexota bacterium]